MHPSLFSGNYYWIKKITYIYVSLFVFVCFYVHIHVTEVYKTINFKQDFITQAKPPFTVQHSELNSTVLSCFLNRLTLSHCSFSINAVSTSPQIIQSLQCLSKELIFLSFWKKSLPLFFFHCHMFFLFFTCFHMWSMINKKGRKKENNRI